MLILEQHGTLCGTDIPFDVNDLAYLMHGSRRGEQQSKCVTDGLLKLQISRLMPDLVDYHWY